MFISQTIKYIATFIGGIAIANYYNKSENNIESIDKIPISYFTEKKILDGKITKVIDGDTYKFSYSKPFPFNFLFFSNNNEKSTVKGFTVRIAGVDTPEMSKNYIPGQPFSIEATEYAKKRLLNKPIKLKLLNKDRYNRVLGIVTYKDGLFHKDIAENLLKAGLATVYRQGGAVYDNKYDKYNKLESNAIRKRKGMWKNGKENADLPSTFKRKLVNAK